MVLGGPHPLCPLTPPLLSLCVRSLARSSRLLCAWCMVRAAVALMRGIVQRAQLMPLSDKLSERMETKVGDRGMTLSGMWGHPIPAHSPPWTTRLTLCTLWKVHVQPTASVFPTPTCAPTVAAVPASMVWALHCVALSLPRPMLPLVISLV